MTIKSKVIDCTSLKYIYTILIFCIIITSNVNCSYIKFIDSIATPKIPELTKGDSITILFVDQTRLDCFFFSRDDKVILVSYSENNESIQKSVNLESILKIKKLKKRPNMIMTIAVGLAALSLFVWAGYNWGLGNL